MNLVLDDKLRIGIQTLHRRTEPAEGPWLPTIDELVEFVQLVDRCGYDFTLGRRPHFFCRADFGPVAATGPGGCCQPAADSGDIGPVASAAASDTGRQTGHDAGPSHGRAADSGCRRRRRISQGICRLRRAAQ